MTLFTSTLDNDPAPAEARAARPADRFERRAWYAVALMMTLCAALGGWSASSRPDLALLKPWRASSTDPHFDAVTRTYDGFEVPIFFHTLEEPSPWVEVDLQGIRPVRQVMIRNRSDCCAERAAPLLIELSDDQKSYREVGRHDKPFSRWSIRVSGEHARYVRIRAARTTILHLDQVVVR